MKRATGNIALANVFADESKKGLVLLVVNSGDDLLNAVQQMGRMIKGMTLYKDHDVRQVIIVFAQIGIKGMSFSSHIGQCLNRDLAVVVVVLTHR